MQHGTWRTEPGGSLVLEAGELRLVVDRVRGGARFLVRRSASGLPDGGALVASGTEAGVQAAMVSAERMATRLTGAPGRNAAGPWGRPARH